MMSFSSSAQGLDARRIGPTLLRACLDKKLTVEEVIAGSREAQAFESRDRALLTSLLLTAFRHKGEIEAVLGTLLDRPLPRKSGPTHEILVLGVAQLLFLAVAPHAVIDLAVRSAKADRNALHFSGLVNAVLRKVANGGQSLREGLDAARLNTPDWLWSRWVATYGEETARHIAGAHGERPALDLSFSHDESTWQDKLDGERLPNGQLRLAAGHAPVPELPGFADGAWWVQDAAASFPVRLLGDVRGSRILDLCAAPGGKTLQLAAAGAHVIAVDLSENRLRRLNENLARTGLTAEVKTEDVLSNEITGEWDGVLLDAPCSATGTIRRHPELPWLKDEAQVRELSGLQRRMLRKAAQLVKPEGLLVYCTCSLEPEEGEVRTRAFLADHPEFAVVPASGAWLPEGAVRPEGWIRTLPCMPYGSTRGLDGFFAVAMRRRA